MSALIYILQDGKDLNTNIYKIGKTMQPIAKRIRPTNEGSPFQNDVPSRAI